VVAWQQRHRQRGIEKWTEWYPSSEKAYNEVLGGIPAESVLQVEVRPLYAALPSPQGEQGRWRLVPEGALKWLNGEGPDEQGVWFGDDLDDKAPRYWWRKRFNDMLAASPRPADEGGRDTLSQLDNRS
jgi:hypothetical protein